MGSCVTREQRSVNAGRIARVLAVFAMRMEHFEAVVTRSGNATLDVKSD